MDNLDDLTGRTFGHLTVLNRGANTANRKTRWYCRCICGSRSLVHGDDLRSGHTTSCGTCSKVDDITGQKFNQLTVLGFVQTAGKRAYWFCQCECGQKITARGDHLRTGNTKSCGCLQPRSVPRKHGMWQRREYRIWCAMKARCQNPKNAGYGYYGGRNIKIAPEFETFAGFFAHMGPCPPKHSIDRIDNEGHYAPGNVRWATHVVQMRNTRANRRLEFNGLSLTKKEWSERTGLSAETITGRLRLGWSIMDCLTIPAKPSDKSY